MAYLLDTNVLLRIAQPSHPQHREARKCVQTLLRHKEPVHIVPQIAYEFWVVATRPVSNNGLGLSVENVRRKVEKAASFFRLILDTPPIYAEWLRIVTAYAVSGVKAHDARIVAAMKVHGVIDLITFNTEDFRRYHGTEITVSTPEEITRLFAVST